MCLYYSSSIQQSTVIVSDRLSHTIILCYKILLNCSCYCVEICSMICIMHCMSDTLSIQTSVLTGMLVLKSCSQADQSYVYEQTACVCVC